MNADEPIDISDDNGGNIERREILTPAIRSVVDALGGYEGGVYRLGDECYGCLKDLKKLWRKDDTDDDRTVARIFYECRVLSNDLVPILLATAGSGALEDKRAIATADLLCAMTWPIDLAEELKELDDEVDARADYTQLLRSHLDYKQALLAPGVLQALFALTLPCLAREGKERSERDNQVVNLVLHLVRNLAFIKDPIVAENASAEAAQLATLQGRLVRTLEEIHFLDFHVTIAANSTEDALFNSWNTIILETVYLLTRGVKPESLAMDQAKQPAKKLHGLLALENKRRADIARNSSSRHSRFGTTISVSLNTTKSSTAATSRSTPTGTEHQIPAPDDASPFGALSGSSARPLVLHRQRALNHATGEMLDLNKKGRAQKGKKTDELVREENLGLEARQAMRRFALSFLRSSFNPLLVSLLKDIKSERAKIAEKDHLRLLCLTRWFLELFRCVRPTSADFTFGMVGEVTESGWIVWVLKRMREAVDVKPKAWNELQAGIECLTELVLLIEAMTTASTSSSIPTEEADALAEIASALQQQLIYNGEVLDIALEGLRAYRPGTQSLAYLDAAVHLAYALLRMLEKWTKAGGADAKELVVRRRARAKARRKASSTEEGEGVVEDAEEEDRDADAELREAVFTFEAFEMKFANADVTATLVAYLERYREFGTAHEKMKRVVSLLHRQAVRAKAEGLFFKVSTLNVFKAILADQKSLPRDQSYKDLLALVNFLLRKFFKAAEEEPFLLIEAFFPKSRGQWKAYSSYEPEPKSAARTVEDRRFPAEVQVKKGFSWSEQVGIAVCALVDADQRELADWTREVLRAAFAKRQLVVDMLAQDAGDPAAGAADGPGAVDSDAGEVEAKRRLEGAAQAARDQFEDELVPYKDDARAEAATRNAQLKLLWRLMNFVVLDEDAAELEWLVPKTLVPVELQRCFAVLGQMLDSPPDLGGKKAAELLSKKARRRRRVRSPSPSSSSDGAGAEWDAVLGVHKSTDDARRHKDRLAKARKEEKARRRGARRALEQANYKSAQFIVDSDVEAGDDVLFFEREAALRARMAAAVGADGGQAARPAGMKASGTKKRKKRPAKDGEGGAQKGKRRRAERAASAASEPDDGAVLSAASSDTDEDDDGEGRTRAPPRPRPKPRPVRRVRAPSASPPAPSSADEAAADEVYARSGGEPAGGASDASDSTMARPGGASDAAGGASRSGGAKDGGPGRARRRRLVLSDDDE